MNVADVLYRLRRLEDVANLVRSRASEERAILQPNAPHPGQPCATEFSTLLECLNCEAAAGAALLQSIILLRRRLEAD